MQAMTSMKRTKTLSVTSGKGGVGKTALICNMALALAAKGRKVLILDGDLGLSNVDILFANKAERTLLDVLQGQCGIEEAVKNLDPNIDLLSGGSGLMEMQRLNSFQRRQLIDCLETLDGRYDYMLIDTAAGISDNVLHLNTAAQKTVLVVNPDPASLTDAYALIKVLHTEFRENHFSIVCNQVRDEVEGLALFNKFNDVVSRFLLVGLDYWGAISQDASFRRATQGQRLILKHEPTSETARQIVNISDKAERSLQRTPEKNGIQFFWEQVVGVA